MLRTTVAVLMLLAVTGGCHGGVGEPAECPAACGCGSEMALVCCQKEPVAYCATVLGCAHSGECPTGTVCVKKPSDDVSKYIPDEFESCRGGVENKYCSIPNPGALEPGATRALIDGFGVSGHTLTRGTSETEAATTVYEWAPPQAATIASCALFACPPEIEDLGDGHGLRIVNHLQCVLRQAMYEPPKGNFDLAELSPPTCRTRGLPRPRVTALLAGCWAYDGARVIAATHLEPVSPRDVPDLETLVVCSCPADASSRACVLPGGGFGTCREGRCHHRCAVDRDCRVRTDVAAPDAGPTDAGPTDTADAVAPEDAAAGATAAPPDSGDVSEPRCERADGSYLGVCLGEADVSSGQCL